MTRPTPKNYQISYQTHGATDADHQALSTFFAVIDAAQSRGKQINHSKRPDQLMIHLGQLYDVADMLGIDLPPRQQLEAAFAHLIWPLYTGHKKITTPIRPSSRRIKVWVFGIHHLASSGDTMANTTLKYKKALCHSHQIDHMDRINTAYVKLQSKLAIWISTVSAVPPDGRISYRSNDILDQLCDLQQQLDALHQLMTDHPT